MIGDVLLSLFSWQNLFYINVGIAVGIFVGAMPGLTATMAIALLLPLTFGLYPGTAILLLLAVYSGAMYRGSIPAILINTPGTPAAAATAMDGYQLARQGKAGQALKITLIASTIGGLISSLAMLLFGPVVARFALRFGPAEYFALAVFGLCIISSVSGKSPVKGLIMGSVGILISTIGIDPVGGFNRMNFGFHQLLGGVNLIPALVGVFAISEVMYKVKEMNIPVIILDYKNQKLPKGTFKSCLVSILRASGIGTFIGAVPGTGPAIAAFLGYNEAKRASKTPEQFGKGSLEGVAAAEAANNAVIGGGLIPTLTLGIPGDMTFAIMLGALMLHGITPGPLLFVHQPAIVYTIMLGLFLVKLLMYFQGLLFIKAFVHVTKVPPKILIPLVFVMCCLGAFAVNNSIFDVYIMMVFGIIGYFMRHFELPIPPMVIAMVLGPIAELNMRNALTLSQGSYLTFVTRPISAFFLFISLLTFVFPYIRQFREKRKLANKG